MLDAILSDALLANDILIAKSFMVSDIILRCVHDGGIRSRMGGKGLEGRRKRSNLLLKGLHSSPVAAAQ
jgi:hypothetical protein